MPTVDETLRKNEIKPAAEFFSELPEFSDLLKALILVHTKRGCIRSVNAA
jgi:hypothetical protein